MIINLKKENCLFDVVSERKNVFGIMDLKVILIIIRKLKPSLSELEISIYIYIYMDRHLCIE